MSGENGGFWDDTAYAVVYLYRYWDPDRGEMVVSEDRATLDAIKAGLGMPLTESGLKVARTDLDLLGRYRVRQRSKAD